MSSLKNQIIELNKELEGHNYNYYLLNSPTISDEEYDHKLVKLRELVGQYPEKIITVLDQVGSDLTGHGKEVKHIRPMLSIRTEVDTSQEPLIKFLERCEKEFPGKELEYVAEHKYDGLAVSLIYNTYTGRPYQAVTRGNGMVGEDISANVLRIPNIQESSPFDPSLRITEVRGEVLMLREYLDRANKWRVESKEKPFVNLRNATAGIIRKSNQQLRYLEFLMFVPYAAYSEDGRLLPDNQADLIELLHKHITVDVNGEDFTPVPRPVKGHQLHEEYNRIKELRNTLPYEIDGVVYKLNNIEDQEQFGISGREPRWSMAHKLPAEQKDTKLQSIDIQVGPSGRLTPVARLQPVFVGGTTVSNCTLSNLFVVRKKGVRAGDIVTVQRAGDVIPEIIGVAVKREKYLPNFRMPKACPVCGGPVVREKEMMNHHCVNSYGCPAQAFKLMAYNASRTMLDIEGLGESNSEYLFKAGFNHFYELFDMNHPGWKIANLGPEITKSLKANIIKASVQPIGVDMFFRLLGINHFGRSSSKKVAALVGSFERFLVTSPDSYKVIGVPSNVIKNIKAFIVDDKAIDIAAKLHQKLTVVNYEENTDGVLAGKTIVLTGSPGNISKTAFAKYLTDMGATLSDSVSKTTSIVIHGEGAGSKLEKAKKYGIDLYTFEEFADKYSITI